MAIGAAMLAAGAIGAGANLIQTGIQSRRQKKEARELGNQSQAALTGAELSQRAAYEGGQQIYGDREQAFAAYDQMLQQQEEMLGNQLAEQQFMATQGMPEESKSLMLDKINRGASTAIQGAESARGGLGGAARAQQSANDAYRQLASMDAEQRLQNKQNLIQGMGNYASGMGQIGVNRLGAENQMLDFKTEAFVDPLAEVSAMKYGQSQRDLDYARALEGARMQNNSQAWNQIGQMSMQAASYGMQNQGGQEIGKAFKNLFGRR